MLIRCIQQEVVIAETTKNSSRNESGEVSGSTYKKPLFRGNRPIITCEKGATVCLIYVVILYQTSIMIGKIIGLRRVCSYKKRPNASFTLVFSDAHSFTFSLISF